MRASRYRAPVLLIAAAVALPSLAQTSADPQRSQDSKEKPASLQGTVVNAITREPVPRAQVRAMLQSSEPRTFGAQTTPDGRFSITGLPSGTYSIDADRPGFSMPPGQRPNENRQVALRPGENREDLRISLVPDGSITGRVLDSAGEPVENVTVSVEGSYGGGAGRTDEEGRFRIGGLTPGSYRLKAEVMAPHTLPREIRTDGTREVHHAPTWYPSSTTPNGAGRVTVRAGAETPGVEIRLVSVPIVRVSGKLAGVPPGATGMHVLIGSGWNFTGVPVKPDGSFEIWRLAPGKYSLTGGVETPSHERFATPPVEIEVASADIEGVVLAFGAPINVSGRIEEEGAPPPPAPESQTAGQGRASRPRRLLMSGTRGMPNFREAEIAPDNTFKVKGLAPGIYRLALAAAPGYVRAVRTAKSESESRMLDLRQASGDVDLTVVIAYATGEVSGKVLGDPEQVAGTAVVLVPEDEEPGGFGFSTAPAGKDGSYRMAEVRPGRYKVIAIPQDQIGLLYRGPNLAPDIAGGLEIIEVRAGEKVVKDVRKYAPEEK